MRFGKLFGISAVLSLFLSCLTLAADFSGTYRAATITLQLAPAAEGYTGTLTVQGTAYPVTAKENAGKLEGSFVSEGARFEFDAALNGELLTLHSANQSYELKRDPKQVVRPQNPLDPHPGTQPTQPAQPTQPTPPTPQPPTPPTDPEHTGPTGDAAIPALKDLGSVQADSKREWLMLVYLDGDNNLDYQGAYNIKQMERGLPESGVEVIVLYDRPIKKEKGGHLNHPCVYRVRPDQHPEILDSEVVKDLGAIDMADPKILAAFIEGAVKKYPARQHALFTWDHGGGWASLTIDENAPGKEHNFDAMDMVRFRAGVVDGMKGAGLKKWDILAFDMCLMAQLEVAAQIHDLTDVMVASEALEPGKGMPYTRVVEALGKGTLGGRRIGANIVTEYDKFHKNDGVTSTTLSALDMSLFDELNTRLNALADKVAPALAKNWAGLARSCFYAEQYADSRDDFRHGTGALQSIDLLDMLKKCRSAMTDFPAETEYKDVVQTMDRFVIASANSQRRSMSTGLAIYFPVIKDAYNPAYEKLDFAKISHWPKLFTALYAEQAKNNEAPKFGKIELVDYQGKPATAVKPLSGFATSIEVEGKNMVWITHMPGVRDPDFGGVRVLVQDYIVDEHFLEKMTKGAEKFSQDVDLIMPQLADGMNKLKEHQFGLDFRMGNGEKTVQVMIDNSDLKDPTSFNVMVDIEHPSLGDKPVRTVLHSDAVSLSILSTTLVQKMPDGRIVLRQIDPPADAKITPVFWLYKDDGTRTLVSKDSLTWNKGLTFTMDLLPPGDYEEILVAETMTGASTTARSHFKIEADEFITQAKQTWQGFRSDMMVGEWQWVLPTDPPKEMPISMTIEASKDPFVYNLLLHGKDDDGKPKTSKGLLILEIHDQPFYRLIIFPEGQGKPSVMLGTMWWSPGKDGTPRVLTRALAFDLNIFWVQKGGKVPPPPIAKDPDGWHRFTDANHQVSMAVPPAFVGNDLVVRQVRAVYPGYDYASGDANSGAGIEIIRFDGVNDFGQALQLIIAGRQQLRIGIQTAAPQQSKIDGVICQSVMATTLTPNGVVYSVGINLIPTPKGIVAIDFACPPANFPAIAPTLLQIAGSIKVAK